MSGSLESLKHSSAAQVADVVKHAMRVHAKDIEMMLVNGFVRDLARQNDKREAYIASYVPDDWVKNIGGYSKFVDLYVTLRIPASIVDNRLNTSKALGKASEADLAHNQSEAGSTPAPATNPEETIDEEETSVTEETKALLSEA